ncbi:MAG: hypothetical protein ACRBEQ_01535 [Hyphomonas sp.]
MSMLLFGYFGLLAGVSGGALMGGFTLFKLPPPKWLPPIHGLVNLGAVFIIFLGLVSSDQLLPSQLWWGLGISVAALAGGLIFFRILYPTKPPFFLIFLHAVLAAIGITLLLPILEVAS